MEFRRRPEAVGCGSLSFLSDDEYDFEFPHLRKDTDLKGRIDFNTNPFDGVVEEVVMFSGGLDSLAGAVQRSVVEGKQVLLVHHRSNEKMARHHNHLVQALGRVPGVRTPLHFTFRANKAKRLGKEYTQRTRSFLFSAFGVVFARMIGLDGLTFFENGVTSLNLPPSAQVVGARPSRTTHPRVLAGFDRLFTALLGKRFRVENRFLWETKTDVVKRIADADCGHLIGCSTSCGHTWELKSRTHTHCGVCSQCIDRRFAVLAAAQEGNDPAERYAVDLLIGDRKDGDQRTMLAAYLDLAARVERMGEADFFTQFGEVARVLPYVGLPTAAGAARVFDLYKRHSCHVRGVVRSGIAAHAEAISRRELPRNCLLRLVYDDPEPIQAAPAEPPRPAGNSMRRRGQCWAIRFGDEENIYPLDRGFDYLRLLLGCPNYTFTAAELASRVRPPTTNSPRAATAGDAAASRVGATAPGSSGAALDDEAIEIMVARLGEIPRQRAIIEASDSPTRLDDLDELDAEERKIRDRLGKDRRLDGRSRALNDVRDRVRNRVCNAIRRALKLIDKYDKPLFEHLQRPFLNLGHRISYVPRAAVTWLLSD